MQNKVLNEITIDQMDELIKAVKGGSSGFDTDASLPELSDGEVTDPLMVVGNDGKAKKLGVKTLFGKHNIRGSGNIDLYKHTIKCVRTVTPSGSSYSSTFYIVIYSSNQLNVDSLTDLKSILGNTFTHYAFGVVVYDSLDSGGNPQYKPVLYITNNYIYNYNSDETEIDSTPVSWTNVVLSDTVTTI